MTCSPAPASAPVTARSGSSAAGRTFPDATGAPTGGGRCRDASARSCPESRSAASRRSASWAASRRAAPATPGPAMSAVNEHQDARALLQRADGAASRSRHPSTTTHGLTNNFVLGTRWGMTSLRWKHWNKTAYGRGKFWAAEGPNGPVTRYRASMGLSAAHGHKTIYLHYGTGGWFRS